jgi:hypothetical protein
MKTLETTKCIRPLSNRRRRAASARSAGLPINCWFERDESIGAQDDAAGMSSGDNETLAQSVVTGRLAQGQLARMEFLSSRRNDLEIVAAVSK